MEISTGPESVENETNHMTRYYKQIMDGLIIIIFLAIFLIFYKIVQGIGTLCFDHVTAHECLMVRQAFARFFSN